MTNVYVVHVKGIALDNRYAIYGIYSTVDLAYDREAKLLRKAYEDGFVYVDSFIETVTLDA